MKKFNGNRDLDTIIEMAEEKGFEVDTQKYDDEGSDWIWVRDVEDRMVQVLYNTFNGHFMAYTPIKDDPTATESSVEFEGVDWYDELLDLFYEPLESVSS